MSTQSSQIRDLCSKLDAAITENSQMQEFLNPSTIQNIITNTLQVAQSSTHHCGNDGLATRQGNPFLGRPQEPQLSAGKDRITTPRKLATITRTPVTD